MHTVYDRKRWSSAANDLVQYGVVVAGITLLAVVARGWTISTTWTLNNVPGGAPLVQLRVDADNLVLLMGAKLFVLAVAACCVETVARHGYPAYAKYLSAFLLLTWAGVFAYAFR